MSLTPRIDTIESKLPTKWQRKSPASDITSAGAVATMAFNNLTPGKTYRITLVGYAFTSNTTKDRFALQVFDGATIVGEISNVPPGNLGSDNGEWTLSFSKLHVMVGTTLTVTAVNVTSSRRWERNLQNGSDNNEATYLQVEEMPNHVATTDWT